MGHHRADTRASRGRRSETPGSSQYPSTQPGKRAAGKRVAEKPARRAAVPSPVPTPVLVERTVEQAPAPAARTSTGRRCARRKSLFRGLPSAPILLGVAALAISAGGAVSAADPSLVGADAASATKIMQASALTGAGAVASSQAPGVRGPIVSRDSRRDRTDSPDAELEAAAEAQLKERAEAFAANNKQADQYNAKLVLNQWQLPVASYHLTARFGDYGLWSSYHTGLDFAAPSGTPIYAVANGTISSASYDGSYGNKTVETLDDGTELWYCHQTSFLVSSGETVRAGQLIGYIGSTGHVTGPHLHLEVRPGGGDPVDPYAALVAHGVTP